MDHPAVKSLIYIGAYFKKANIYRTLFKKLFKFFSSFLIQKSSEVIQM